jgi:hypothetical protein
MSSTGNKVVSYSEIDAYRQCRLKHQLAYIENWRVPADDEAEALARGTLFHSVMESHYGVIMGAQEGNLVEQLEVSDFWNAANLHLYDDQGRQSERQELVEWMYTGYIEQWLVEDLSNWDIVKIEMPMTCNLGPGIDLAGTTDLLVKDKRLGGGLWIVDHKTCKNLPKQKDFDMEDQTGIYAHLAKTQLGLDIRGAIYNFVRTYRLVRDMSLEERHLRHITVRTDQELATMANEAYQIMAGAYADHERRIETIVIDSHTSEGDVIDVVYDAPRSPDGERCGWKCGFTEACIAGRKLGPERTRTFLEDIGMTQHDTKPGPTFNKSRA